MTLCVIDLEVSHARFSQVADLLSIHRFYTTGWDANLDNLATALHRPRAEVYLAAGRITPELASKLEQGMPITVPQIGMLLSALEADLSLGFGELGGLSLEAGTTEEDRAVAGKIMEAVNHINEIAQALNRGEITAEQFEHVAENIRQLKLALLTRGQQKETP